MDDGLKVRCQTFFTGYGCNASCFLLILDSIFHNTEVGRDFGGNFSHEPAYIGRSWFQDVCARVVLQGPGPLYGHAMDLVGQSFLVAVSGKMVNPICNNSCLRCGLSHADNLAGFCYSGLSKSLPRL